MEQNIKQLMIQAIDNLDDIYTQLVDEYRESKEEWSKLAEIGWYLILMREKTILLP